MHVLVCSYIKTSRHPRRGIRACARVSAPSRSHPSPLSFSSSRNACTYEQVASSPTTACSLIFADYLKSKSFYLSEGMELSNDPAVFQHYIRLTSSPYHNSTCPTSSASPRVDAHAANVLFTGATRGRYLPHRFRYFSSSARACSIDDGSYRARDVWKYFFICYSYKLQKAFCFANRHLFTVKTKLCKQSFQVCLFWI